MAVKEGEREEGEGGRSGKGGVTKSKLCVCALRGRERAGLENESGRRGRKRRVGGKTKEMRDEKEVKGKGWTHEDRGGSGAGRVEGGRGMVRGRWRQWQEATSCWAQQAHTGVLATPPALLPQPLEVQHM